MRARFSLFVVVVLLALPASASAGRLIVTGHDADRRCALMHQQCGFLKTAIKYVRQTSPAARKPVLVLDRGSKQLVNAIKNAWSSSYGGYTGPKLTVVDPRSAKFRTLLLDYRRWSTIAVASDSSCGGCDLEPADADALAKRKRQLQTFLSRGGGMYVGAGGANAAGYYRFLPIPAPGPASDGPFQLTRYGQRIGFKAGDVTCCAVANTFATPDVGSMDVAAQTANKVGDTLIADGQVKGGKLIANATIPPVEGGGIVVRPVTGVVLGHPPDDPKFRRIVGVANLVPGWTFDVTHGRVALTTAAGRGAVQSAEAYEGFFTALQQAGSPVTDLKLRSGNFDAACGSGGVDVARASANSTPVRHLWTKGKGKFRTVGRFASASIRGTEWETVDRCDGTLVVVKTGAVNVFDQILQKTKTVTAGGSYLAQAP
ncbi:MAG: hypothetical protein ACJ76Z_00800 [Thermoleophilaceae bacterium]